MAIFSPAERDRSQRIRDLHQLIEALDRRLLQMRPHGDTAIVREAVALRRKAVERLRALGAREPASE